METLVDADPILGTYSVGDEIGCGSPTSASRRPARSGAGIDTDYRIVGIAIKPGDQGTPSTSTLALGPAL